MATYIGRPLKRFEDPRLLQGQGTFVDDLQLPGMLHAVVLRSPHAHVRLVSVDTAAARALPGVVAMRLRLGRGDPQAAFAKADCIVRRCYEVPRLSPVPMECRGLVDALSGTSEQLDVPLTPEKIWRALQEK